MDINAAEFKAKCLKLIDDVAKSREPLVITKRGKPVVKVVPLEIAEGTSLFGYMRGTVTIRGDIMEVPHEAPSAESGEEGDLYADFRRGARHR